MHTIKERERERERERKRENIQQTNIKLDGRPSPPPVFSMFCVAQSSVFFCLVLCRFVLCFLDCTVCPSIYGFSLPLWYLQNLPYKSLFRSLDKENLLNNFRVKLSR